MTTPARRILAIITGFLSPHSLLSPLSRIVVAPCSLNSHVLNDIGLSSGLDVSFAASRPK